MKRRSSLILSVTAACLILLGPSATATLAQRIARQIPVPAADHPGNVFLAGEEVSVKAAANLASKAVRWRAMDDSKSIVGQGALEKGNRNLKLGVLDIGWYRLEFLDEGDKAVEWTSAAVLASLAEPTPQDSPICVDSATAWFANGNAAKQERFARLAALAGVNWIRDRLSWGGVHRGPIDFAQNTTYDSAASLQAKHGLKLLQVFHDSPGWAVDKQLDDKGGAKRFTRDLRLLYKFCTTMAKRYEGRVLAWEPWNEANIDVFGGHTIDEMCAHQKAAYLAFKAGNPKVTVCWNVYAGAGSNLHTQGVIENESWPYFETYNIHSYRKPEQYVEQFAPAREAACGRPIWITECGVPLPWTTGGPGHELSQADELKQARFLARSYASSLFAGVNRHFFFILGNYGERKIQFGLLRDDQTPRPGYVALAAIGRLLAGAKCLGRLPGDDESVRVYAFRARPDAKSRDVLVVWADKPTKWSLPENVTVDAVYDYLGRPLTKAIPQTVDSAPLFVLLAKGKARELSLEDPLQLSAFRQGTPSPVVLQLQMPQSATNLNSQAHTVDLKQEVSVDIFAYNFSGTAAKGLITVEQVPDGWRLAPERMEIDIEPMGRKRLPIRVSADNSGEKPADGWIKLRGEFSDAGRPVLAFRLVQK